MLSKSHVIAIAARLPWQISMDARSGASGRRATARRVDVMRPARHHISHFPCRACAAKPCRTRTKWRALLPPWRIMRIASIKLIARCGRSVRDASLRRRAFDHHGGRNFRIMNSAASRIPAAPRFPYRRHSEAPRMKYADESDAALDGIAST